MTTYGSVCSGIEAATVAWHPIGWSPAWFAEIEKFPSSVLAHHYPAVANLGDMTKIAAMVRAGIVAAPDVLVGGTPCFTAGHMVLCSAGYKSIESVVVDDLVVTHIGRLQRVLRVGSKLAKVGKLTGVGMASGIVTTPDHPFLSVDFRMQSTKRNGAYAKIEQCGAPEWVEAQQLIGKNWCALTHYEIPGHDPVSAKFDAETAMYLAGMYLGDGYIRKWGGKNKKSVVFCLNKSKVEKFKVAAPGIGAFTKESRGSIKVIVCDTAFAEWLMDQFGELSHCKRIPAWVAGSEFGAELLRGYLDTDGGMTPNGFVANSVSHALALGIVDLANCNGYSAGLTFMKTQDTCVIEGRTVNQRDYWSVKAVHADVSRKSRVRHGYLLRRAQSYTPVGIDTVYNIEVEGDNSYVLNGAVVHNCQAFSIAGLRASMDDARGQLTLSFVDLANAIDAVRHVRGEPESIIVWENVPGVLSTKDNAFGCFLGALAGEDSPLVAPGGRWSNAGCVYGPQRNIAWRTLDAQYFGVAQRRRRVFVVASARDGFDPAAVLFEFDGVRRDIAPRRESRQEITGTLGARASSGGGFGTDFECAGGIQPVAFGGNNQSGSIDVATARNACASASGRMDFETETFLVQDGYSTSGAGYWREGIGALRGRSQDSHENVALSVALRGREGGATAELGDEVATCLRASGGGGDKAHVFAPIAFDSRQDTVSSTEVFGALGSSSPQAQAVCITGDITHTLKADGFDASEDGTGRGQPIVATRYAVRRLTVPECESLQGFPRGYLGHVLYRGKPPADCPMYKAMGNSFAVPVVRWIGERIQSMVENIV